MKQKLIKYLLENYTGQMQFTQMEYMKKITSGEYASVQQLKKQMVVV